MRRREIIALLGGATALPFAARAQTPARRPLVGFLSAVSKERNVRMTDAFAQGLRELGFVEGRDFEVVSRFGEGHLDRLPSLAHELVELNPSVILAAVTAAAVALKKWTDTVPIVCPLLGDPIRLGLIASMARPGGNVTGVPKGWSASSWNWRFN